MPEEGEDAKDEAKQAKKTTLKKNCFKQEVDVEDAKHAAKEENLTSSRKRHTKKRRRSLKDIAKKRSRKRHTKKRRRSRRR